LSREQADGHAFDREQAERASLEFSTGSLLRRPLGVQPKHGTYEPDQSRMARMNATATASPHLEKGGGEQAAAADLVRALNHSVRRSVLRFLLEKQAPASTAEIRRGVPGFVGNNLGHHLDILVDSGTLVRNRKQVGYRERFFEPTDAIQVPWFLTVLRLTAKEDRR
jgi:hypothetical protein